MKTRIVKNARYPLGNQILVHFDEGTEFIANLNRNGAIISTNFPETNNFVRGRAALSFSGMASWLEEWLVNVNTAFVNRK